MLFVIYLVIISPFIESSYDKVIKTMNHFKRILLGMDLSDMDYQLLEYLKVFSTWNKPEQVYLVHVSPSLRIPASLKEWYETEEFPPMDEQINKEIRAELDEKMPERRFPADIEVLEGPVTNQLLHWTDVKSVDLAIVGRKSSNFGTGLSARRFARKSHASVMFVPKGAKANIKRILVPTDYSDYSAFALEEAIKLARKLPGKPEIIHLFAYDVPAEVHLDLIRTKKEFERMLLEGAKEYQQKFLERFDTEGVKITPVMIQNKRLNPAWYIHSYAEENEVDLIMIGAQGHSSLAAFMLGSVAEKLIHLHESSPVMILRKPVNYKCPPIVATANTENVKEPI